MDTDTDIKASINNAGDLNAASIVCDGNLICNGGSLKVFGPTDTDIKASINSNGNLTAESIICNGMQEWYLNTSDIKAEILILMEF